MHSCAAGRRSARWARRSSTRISASACWGHALSRRAGKDYEALVTERVLGPLGMTETRVTLPDAWRARLAMPHTEASDPGSWWDLPTLAGAGALRSTAADMLTFLAAQMPRAGGSLAAPSR